MKTKKNKLPKSHFNGYDCKNGTHKVTVIGAESVKLCNSCYKKFMKGPQ